MTRIKEMEKQSKIEEIDVDNIIRILYASFLIERPYPDNEIIKMKEDLINSFSQLIVKYLDSPFISSNQDKLKLINFLDKLIMQKELLELEMGKTNLSDIELAGKRLGKKAQSAFGHKQSNK